MLLLLGDQLIRDPGIAVFELVKNAYDADSPDATVTMSNLTDSHHGSIIVEDSGTGMDYLTVATVWLEPGTDFRDKQRRSGHRTEKYRRLPLGEKGVGRFAAHKLGNHVTLVTRKINNPEIVVDINWAEFDKHDYLEQVPVQVRERMPEVFGGRRTGTIIEITNLRNPWNRGMVRELYRSVTSICSPFDDEGEFKADLILSENSEWLKDLMTVEEVLEYSLFRAKCNIQGNQVSYDYEFVPLPAMNRVTSRQENKTVPIKISAEAIDNLKNAVGPVDLDLYIFDLDPKILTLGVTDKKGLKSFLAENGGIRVYRDGIRVYDYGEAGNDWLDLGGRRVNVPTRRISNNLVIGAVSLHLADSPGLVEKTNREGFVDNKAFRAFREAVTAAVNHIVTERNKDKTRIRNAYSKRVREPVLQDLSEVRELIEKKNLTKDLGPYLDRIESDFLLIRDRFLTSASAGLSLSVVIHEVEKGVKELVIAVKREQPGKRITALAKHLADLIEGYAALIRRSGTSRERASNLISRAAFNTELRLKNHGIQINVNQQQGDFEVKCSRRLIISTIMNLIDNAIWWLDTRWGELKNKKRIYIGISKELLGGPAIVVADNGPGFLDPPEYLIEPFISRKPDGMGLGLHLADQVMIAQGGRLEFPQSGDLALPKEFDGAVVALVFGGNHK
ncbi:MAG: ATP-binding protein [Thermodesulfobacteriota bacterium]